MTKDHKITIINASRVMRNINMIVGITCGTVAPIGLGVLVDSVPMQWVGFMFGVLFLFAFAARHAEPKFTNAADAKAYLDELKSKGEIS